MRSSFIENSTLQWAWDSTSLNDLKTCARKYYYIIVQGYRSTKSSIHLDFGTIFHDAIYIYENCKAEGQSHDEAVFHATREVFMQDYPTDNEVLMMENSGKRKTRPTLLRTVIWYLDNYQDEEAKTIILENGKPAVEVSFNFDTTRQAPNGAPYLLCGHLDRMVMYNDDPFVLDHKTTISSIGGYFFSRFDPDNQMSLYSIAGQIVLQSPVRGVIIDGISIDSNGYPQFGRGFTHRTQASLDEWLKDLDYHLSAAEQYATDNYYPMNDTACDKYGGCPFRKVCSKAPHLRDTFLAADFTQLPEEERWNPLIPR